MANLSASILIGPPGAGKTTWSQKWAADAHDSRIVISKDALRESLGVYWVPKRELIINQLEHQLMLAAYDHRFDVCVDDASYCDEQNLKSLIGKLKRLGYIITIVVFNAEYASCINRIHERKDKRNIDADVLNYWFEKYTLLKSKINDISGEFGTSINYEA